MTGLVDWAIARARMVLAFIILSLGAGAIAYAIVPKEGEPDIDIPAIIISMPYQGISAEDSEKLLIKPMETELSDLDGLKKLKATAADGYANVVLEFEFGWDRTKILADVRDRMNDAQRNFPKGGATYSISEFNFSEFPIIIISLSGSVPERTLLKAAEDLQDRIEGLEPVLSAGLTGHREEMLEVLIDPLKLETYNVTASELIGVVVNNNQLIPAGSVNTENSNFSVKIPSSFDAPVDVYNLPVKTNGDRVVTLGDIADIRLTFADRTGTARFNGETTVAIQVSKRKGFNLIDTANLVREEVAKQTALWPAELKNTIKVSTSNDQSRNVEGMVKQLEDSVLTAVALVMIVILAALGSRPALLVGFAIPTSFLLCFVFLAVMGISVSNIVMFGLILAVGMLVDGAIVVVEYADRRISEGAGPMLAYADAAKRMFWPIVSSTATTLCAFLPMLFWPGVPGQFMGMLPVTLIFVLSASLVVTLIYLPVLGGVSGSFSEKFGVASDTLRRLPLAVRVVLVPISLYWVFVGAMQLLNPGYLFGGQAPEGIGGTVLGIVLFLVGAMVASIVMGAVEFRKNKARIEAGHKRTAFGHFIKFITGNPVMPIVTLVAVIFFVITTFQYFAKNNNGVEFFVATEPEQAIVYVQARGNLSVKEKDALLKQAEAIIINTPGVQSTFAFAGEGGLNGKAGGGPLDTIGQAQIELIPWEDRPTKQTNSKIFGFIPWTSSEIEYRYDGNFVLNNLQEKLDDIPGVRSQIVNLDTGPASAKPVHLRLKGDDWDALLHATALVREKFEQTEGLVAIEDTLPLPGIDWQIDVDVQEAGRYGADVAAVGAMVQLVTRGILLDTMRVESSDEEIDIRVRLPEADRVLSTLDTLKVRTRTGLIPLSNFISRKPVAKLGQIKRLDQQRYFEVKAGVRSDAINTLTDENGVTREIKMTPADRIAEITTWLDSAPLPAGIEWEWTGNQEDEADSRAFLVKAFLGALGLMFIILLAQFNSFYNSVLVLLAVIISTTGVLIGMLVMGQTFSIIMTGTGIVALAGIVVNNNIVLIDTYQEYSAYMPRQEAIIRTAEARIRPVMLTTITTIAGLLPMMFGLSLDFIGGGYTVDAPTALYWKQLATAVVFGLGIATMLTLVFTPAMLALRIWMVSGAYGAAMALRAGGWTAEGRRIREDFRLNRSARKLRGREISWEDADLIDSSAP